MPNVETTRSDHSREPLLTIGYGSKRSLDDFIQLLQTHGVDYLVDVRTRPFSKFRNSNKTYLSN